MKVNALTFGASAQIDNLVVGERGIAGWEKRNERVWPCGQTLLYG